jgi:Zn-dependent peptidase ImmA (M78 family)/DNA-binding XRE family transcriptional regulator
MKPGTPGFFGERLLEAREARGLTGIALGDLVGVPRNTICQYEKNTQTPRPEVMQRLTEVLNLPIEFFLRSPVSEGLGVFHYRSLAAATKGARKRAQRRHVWLRDIVAWLSERVEFPEVNFPDFRPPADPALIDRDHIERTAIQVRRHWSMADGPIERVVWLLENRGAIVSLSDFGSEDLDAFSESGQECFEPFVSVSSDKVIAARSNFTASHELGHLVLHRNVPENVANRTVEHKLMEQQANAFADAFLLPATSFVPQVRYPTLEQFRTLKSKWRVSIGAMIMRSRDLRLINQEQYTHLWIAYSKRGWRHGEPLDEILVDARPRVLKRSFELVLSEGISSTDEIRAALPYAPSDIESLCGLEAGMLSESARVVRLPERTTPPPRQSAAQVIAFRRRQKKNEQPRSFDSRDN